VHTPVHKAHIHYFDFIESFPKMKEGPNDQEKHVQYQQILRDQLINGQSGLEQQLCLRNCFKMSEKKYVEFCLDRKCGGVDIQKAGKILGYVKN
ncbi:hypothetical protein IMG5_062850, partial [Ichthyophthirius multifiliis]